jgi:hypothetical protein
MYRNFSGSNKHVYTGVAFFSFAPFFSQQFFCIRSSVTNNSDIYTHDLVAAIFK